MPDYIRTTECTVQRHDGSFCETPSAPDMPFPICLRHATRLHEHLQTIEDTRRAARRDALEASVNDPAVWARVEKLKVAQSQVYYVRIGDYIKIGYTTNLTARLVGLRADADQVLATEPGGAQEERARHLQFAHLRKGRRENFRGALDLIQHIDRVNEKHGPPRLTTHVKPVLA